jgi:hypothetical protein
MEDVEYWITFEHSDHGDGPIIKPNGERDWRVKSMTQGPSAYGSQTIAILWERDNTR